MLHAKTAVADGRWARVGSTNLNVASWLGNCELDVIAEDRSFARRMESMYLDDLTNATEIVLDGRRTRPSDGRQRPATAGSGTGSAGRTAAGLLRIGNAVGAAVTGQRVLEPVETQITLAAGVLLAVMSVALVIVPRVFAYPLSVVTGWLAVSLLYRSYVLRKDRRSGGEGT
jgi:cardiolipin synthase